MATATSIRRVPADSSWCCSLADFRAFHGPNGWSSRPTLEFRWTTDAWSERHVASANALLGTIGIEPIDVEHAGEGSSRGARWFAEAVLRLQTAGESDVAFCDCRAEGESSCRVAVEFEEERTARAAAELLERWLRRAFDGGDVSRAEEGNQAREWRQFLDLAYDARLGNTTRAIVRAAAARGMPWLRLDDESLVQLGQGVRQRRVETALTDRTSAIAQRVATDKGLAKRLLDAAGVPVPEGREAQDAGEACRAAEELGWPVVVKPLDADYGDGVSIRLTDSASVRTAFATARSWSDRVLVERFIPGTLFRMLVIDGRLASVVRRESAFVIGDGLHTIDQLVTLANRDVRRPGEERSWKARVAGGGSPDSAESGASNDLTRAPWAYHGEPDDWIPEAGRTVSLRRDCFLRSGGCEVERVADVHPEFSQLAVDAARIVGLDVAGLDVIAADLENSPWSQPCAVLEVNPQPALVLHRAPLCVPGSRVCETIVESLFGAGETGRLPLVAVVGDEAADREARRLVGRWQARGVTVGLATRTGAWLDGRRLGASRDVRVLDSLRRLWRHPRTEGVVVHLTPGDLVGEGIPFERCDELVEVGVVRTWRERPDVDPTELERVLKRLRGTVVGAGRLPGNDTSVH